MKWMVAIYTFLEVEKNLKKDALSGFMKEMTFVPHAFGHQSNNPDAVCGDRIIGDFELICIVGGESHITIDNTLYVCFAGDAVLIPPFTMHKIQTPALDPHENYWIHFDLYPFHMQKPFISAVLGNTGNKLHPGMSEELVALYRLLNYENSCEKPGRMLFVGSLLVQIMIEILRLNRSPVPVESTVTSLHPSEAEIVRKSLDFIQNNVFNCISLADLITHLHISEAYLFKSFSVIMQMPPNQFLQLVKIKKAEQLLKSTNHTVKQISEMLGFSSPFYFCNVYKKYYKISPREYMRALGSPRI